MVCIFNPLFAQVNFTSLRITPAFPQQGGKVQFAYNPLSTPLRASKKIEALVYLFNNKTQVVHEINLAKNNNGSYSGSFSVDTNSTALALVFSDSTRKDNNNNNGYVIPVYDKNNQPVHGANYALATVFNYWGKSFLDVDPDREKAFSYMQTEWKQSPELHTQIRGSYFYLLNRIKKKEAEPEIKKELEAIENNPAINEDDYDFMVQFYKQIKDTTDANRLYAIEKTKYPKGSWVIAEKITEIVKEKDTLKQLALIDNLLHNYHPKSEAEKNQFQFLKITAASKSAGLEKFDAFENYLKDMPMNQKASAYNNTAWDLANKNENLSFAKKISMQATDWVKRQWQNPSLSKDKPAYFTIKEWKDNLKQQYITYGDTYAFVLYQSKDYKQGFDLDQPNCNRFK